MSLDKLRSAIRRLTFAVFIVFVFSLGTMKPSVDLFSVTLTPSDILFPFFFLLLVGSVATGSIGIRWRTEHWAVVAYLFTAAISAALSIDPILSFKKLLGVAYLVALALSASWILSTVGRLRATVIAFLLGAFVSVLVAATAVITFYAEPSASFLSEITYHYGAVPVGNFPRVSSTFVSPSMFCNYLTVAFVFAVIARRMQWLGRSLAFALIALLSLSACFTVSVAIGGFFLTAGLCMWLIDENHLRSRLAVIAASIVAILFLGIAAIDLSQRITRGSLAPSSRVGVWNESIETFAAHPLTGKGLGTGAASVLYQNTDGTWSILTDAHNVFLNIGAESGIVGILGVTLLIVVVLRTAFRPSPVDPHIQVIRYALGIAFTCSFLYDGLTGSFEDARHVWLLIGLILASGAIVENDV